MFMGVCVSKESLHRVIESFSFLIRIGLIVLSLWAVDIGGPLLNDGGNSEFNPLERKDEAGHSLDEKEVFRGVESDLGDSFAAGEIRAASVLSNDGCPYGLHGQDFER
ncbi:hypothetical protein Tco_0732186 [Tanacetum coccineum]